jgi:NAD(P)H dehydrogenase (quinone)
MSQAKVHVIVYSLYGHTLKLAEQVMKGLAASGVEAKLFQVPETLPLEGQKW